MLFSNLFNWFFQADNLVSEIEALRIKLKRADDEFLEAKSHIESLEERLEEVERVGVFLYFRFLWKLHFFVKKDWE